MFARSQDFSPGLRDCRRIAASVFDTLRDLRSLCLRHTMALSAAMPVGLYALAIHRVIPNIDCVLYDDLADTISYKIGAG
jgi:hypothetical protein